MTTEIGFLKRHDGFIFEGEKYKILGIGNRSYNNVQCQNIETKKRKWFDLSVKVVSIPHEEVDNLCDTNKRK